MRIRSTQPGRIDLHVHTTYSDGSETPAEVIQRAIAADVGTIAITDHDTIAGVDEARAAGAAAGVQVLPGVEITAHTEEDGDLHVLGYFLDFERAEELRHLLDDRLAERRRRLESMITKLADRGIRLDPQEVLPEPPTAPARPHLATALIEGGHAADIRDTYSRLIGPHCECFESCRPLPIEDAIAAIRRASGVAILAHPARRIPEMRIRALVALGLDGIEVYHAKQPRRTSKRLRGLAMAHDWCITGGSDYHGPAVRAEVSVGESTLPPHDFAGLVEALEARRRAAGPNRTLPSTPAPARCPSLR